MDTDEWKVRRGELAQELAAPLLEKLQDDDADWALVVDAYIVMIVASTKVLVANAPDEAREDLVRTMVHMMAHLSRDITEGMERVSVTVRETVLKDTGEN